MKKEIGRAGVMLISNGYIFRVLKPPISSSFIHLLRSFIIISFISSSSLRFQFKIVFCSNRVLLNCFMLKSCFAENENGRGIFIFISHWVFIETQNKIGLLLQWG